MYRLLYSLVITTGILLPQQQPLQTAPVVINLYNSSQSSAESMPVAVATNEVSQHVKVSQYAQFTTTLHDIAGHAYDTLPSLLEHCKHNIRSYKWSIAAGIALTSYCTLCALLVRDNFFLNQADLWAQWHAEYTLQDLCSHDPIALRKELITTIQERYFDSTKPTECIMPLITFMRDITYEQKRIKSYCTRAPWLTSWFIRKLLPITQEDVAHAQHLLDRLNFIHHLFKSWVSEYNWHSLQTQAK